MIARIAKYSGTCAKTGLRFQPGTPIVKGTRGWEIDFSALEQQNEQNDYTKKEILNKNTEETQNNSGEEKIHVSVGEGYGGVPFEIGQVIKRKVYDKKTKRIEEKILVVIETSKQYYEQDGMSFGVGDEVGYVYKAVCRLATKEETEQFLIKEEENRQRVEKRKMMNQGLQKLFDAKNSNTPQGKNIVLKGEVVPIGKGQNIWGGGRWFVLDEDEEHVWLVINNGMDGDDWNLNNIVTNGAGAIGYRFEKTPERMEIVQMARDGIEP